LLLTHWVEASAEFVLLSKPHEYWRLLDHTATYTDFKKEMWDEAFKAGFPLAVTGNPRWDHPTHQDEACLACHGTPGMTSAQGQNISIRPAKQHVFPATEPSTR
jgi:hypothetical protein